MHKFLFVLTGLLLAGAATAKLPPLSDEAKAKADETKAKTAWGDKVAAYKLCLAQDRAVAAYVKAKGVAKPTADLPQCQDPGPYVPAQAAGSATPTASAPVKK